MGKQKTKQFNNNGLRVGYIEALTDRQDQVLRSDNNLVLCGSAGTGKTYLASYLGLKSVITDNEHEKVIFLRSAVATRDIGFLKGSAEEKLKVYERPYVDICANLIGRGDAYEILKSKRQVFFEPTSFIRGVTFRDAFVIVDECQNMTYHELDSIITRLDDNCKIVFCGDIAQADLLKNGFKDFYSVLKRMKEFDFVEFTIDDVVRGPLVKSYLKNKQALFGI